MPPSPIQTESTWVDYRTNNKHSAIVVGFLRLPTGQCQINSANRHFPRTAPALQAKSRSPL
ncbi:hypothetical protein DSO57_1028804 [Entomophthora muscae]|uniref:Uncharacterized protein n=1 Tax=Entomophthora muscae TaxID=34485 RepID=A0ACC2RG58_9FUNG|nr:hypothetical protein DSO57_1028804 [Entomophthora muscae]